MQVLWFCYELNVSWEKSKPKLGLHRNYNRTTSSYMTRELIVVAYVFWCIAAAAL